MGCMGCSEKVPGWRVGKRYPRGKGFTGIGYTAAKLSVFGTFHRTINLKSQPMIVKGSLKAKNKADVWGRSATLAEQLQTPGLSRRARGSGPSRHLEAVLPLPMKKMTSNGVESSLRA